MSADALRRVSKSANFMSYSIHYFDREVLTAIEHWPAGVLAAYTGSSNC